MDNLFTEVKEKKKTSILFTTLNLMLKVNSITE